MSVTCAVLLIAGFFGQNSGLPPIIEKYGGVMGAYYRAPKPDLAPELMACMISKENLEHPWFVNKDNVVQLLGSQLGDIARGNAKSVRDYESQFPDAPPAGRVVLLRALIICGDRETVPIVDRWLADKRFEANRNELESLKSTLQNPERKAPWDRPAKEPKDLDFCWANFLVTGEYPPVSRILDVLDLPDTKQTEIMKRVARWSVDSNLKQHPKLVELVRKNLKDRPETSRKEIEQLLKKHGE